MCGICAINRRSGKSSIYNPRLFMQLAAESIESRGPHATGFGWQSVGDPHTRYWKMPGKASVVARDAAIRGELRSAIGHTRYATQGKPEIVGPASNNHPILEPGVVLVHNGVVHNDREIFKKMPEDWERKNEVDSQAIACLIAYHAHLGYEHPIEAIEGELIADYALAWLNTEDPGALHLAVGHGRPMHIGNTRRGDLVMASTDEALDKIERWSGLRIGHRTEVPDGTYFRVFDGEITESISFVPKVRTWPKSHTTTNVKATQGTIIGTPPSKPSTPTVTNMANFNDVPLKCRKLGGGEWDHDTQLYLAEDGEGWAWVQGEGYKMILAPGGEPVKYHNKRYLMAANGNYYAADLTEPDDISEDDVVEERNIRHRYWRNYHPDDWTREEWLDNLEAEWGINPEDVNEDDPTGWTVSGMLEAFKMYITPRWEKENDSEALALWNQEELERLERRLQADSEELVEILDADDQVPDVLNPAVRMYDQDADDDNSLHDYLTAAAERTHKGRADTLEIVERVKAKHQQA